MLISSPNCEIVAGWNVRGILPYAKDFHRYSARLNAAASAYAQQCYDENATTQQCSVFVRKAIQPSTLTNTTCPFPGKDKICTRNSTNFRIDTGLLNSHTHLGMNTAPRDRFGWRRTLECAPLITNGYTKISNHSDPTLPPSIEYLYGAGLNSGDGSVATYQAPTNKTTPEANGGDYQIE